MTYDRRKKMLQLAKQQMRANDIEYAPPHRERVSETEEFQVGSRSGYKEQQNMKRKVARGVSSQIRNDLHRTRHERGTDRQGRDWASMPEGTLIKFIRESSGKLTTATGLRYQRVEKDTLATVIKEYTTEGKRWVDVLVGAQVITIAKSSVEEI